MGSKRYASQLEKNHVVPTAWQEPPLSRLWLPSTLSDVFPGSALPVPGSILGPPSVLDPSPCSCPHSKFLPLRGLEGVPGLPGAPQDEAGLTPFSRGSSQTRDQTHISCLLHWKVGSWVPPCSSDGKESACNVGDLGSIPESGRSPGEGNVYPL